MSEPMTLHPFHRLPAAAGVALALLFQAGCATVTLDVPYVPTPDFIVNRMLEMGDVGPNDYLIDLGSGDGRIPIAAAVRHGTRGLGVDIDPERVREARQNAATSGVSRLVDFRVQNLFETAIKDATVVTLYLLPTINLELRPRLLTELKPGTRVVSHAFDMDDWRPDQSDILQHRTLYMWIIPAQIAGRWRIEGDASHEITLTQQFQQVEGTVVLDGVPVGLDDVVLRGEQIRFSIDGHRFYGRVNGDIIEPVEETGTVRNWRATKI